MNTVKMKDQIVGVGHPCLIVAEAGINHNGDIDMAHDLIEAAAAAGADACKFQNYHTEDFVSDQNLSYEYYSEGRTVTESQYDMFKRCELPRESLPALRRHSERCGLLFLSTPSSAAGVDDLIAAGAHGVKNGSDALENLPLIGAMGASGLPTILSTGMAHLAEIDEAIRAYRNGGGHQLILLHCTSAYPTAPEDAHLRKITTLCRAFGCPVGFSDHTEGIVAATGAIALGASVIEKHFTLDRSLPGPDHWFSADTTELAALVRSVRTIEKQLGSDSIGPTPGEVDARRSFRLSCVAAAGLPRGHRLISGDIAFRRPGTGLPPKGALWLVGRVLREKVAIGTVLEPHHFV